jgi:hypothetical protein
MIAVLALFRLEHTLGMHVVLLDVDEQRGANQVALLRNELSVHFELHKSARTHTNTNTHRHTQTHTHSKRSERRSARQRTPNK